MNHTKSIKTFFNIINGNYLSLTGGELSGSLTVSNRLAVRNDQNSDLALEKQSGDKSGYTIRRQGDDLFIYQSKNGATEDKYIAQYQKDNDTWDFNAKGLAKKGSEIIDSGNIGDFFKYSIKNISSDKLRNDGWLKFPNGLILQWVYKSWGGFQAWPIPYTSWVMAVSGGIADGDKNRDWNITTDLTGVSVSSYFQFAMIFSIGQ